MRHQNHRESLFKMIKEEVKALSSTIIMPWKNQSYTLRKLISKELYFIKWVWIFQNQLFKPSESMFELSKFD